MKVVSVTHLEDCFDGSFIKEIAFTRPLDEDFIRYLLTAGEAQYFPDFARPFFKVATAGKYEFKGVAGNLTIRIILKGEVEKSLAEFLEFCAQYRPDKIPER